MHADHTIDIARIDELARRLGNLVPPTLRDGRDDLRENFKAVLQNALGRMNPVTRDEIDALRTQTVRLLDRLADIESELAEWRQTAGTQPASN